LETYAAEGGNITIICNPEAAPTPKFVWKKDGNVIGECCNYLKNDSVILSALTWVSLKFLLSRFRQYVRDNVSVICKQNFQFCAWDMVVVFVSVTVYSSSSWTDPEGEDATVFQNVGNYLPITTVKHHRRLESSIIPRLRN
jgi:hypothetical protein